MENLTGGTPPVRYLPCVVPCKLYFFSHKIENLHYRSKKSTIIEKIIVFTKNLGSSIPVRVTKKHYLK